MKVLPVVEIKISRGNIHQMLVVWQRLEYLMLFAIVLLLALTFEISKL